MRSTLGQVVVIVVAASAGCGSSASPSAPVDAAFFDAAPEVPCINDMRFEPIAPIGYTPSGSLDAYHFALAYYSCSWFGVEVTQTMMDANCNAGRSMELDFDFPIDAIQPGSGSFPVRAYEYALPNSLDGTEDITFEATYVDPPTTASARIAGRFVSNTPGWSLDLPIDLHASGFDPSCTLSTH
jgi:hypothetical protein